MDFKSKKGSITIFVLVGLLFMSAFLIISYAYNVNKSKVANEQFNIISDIYSYKDGDENAYTRAYTALRKKNVQTFSFENEEDADKTIFENTNTVELTKTFDGNLSNYRIYGNSVQNGTPSPENPVEIQSVGDLSTNLFNLEGRTVKDFGAWSNTTIRNLSGDSIFLGVSASNYKAGEITNYSVDEKNNKVEFVASRGWYGVGFDFKAEPNTTYTISTKSSSLHVGISEYAEDGTYIKGESGAKKRYTITTSETTKWIVVILNPGEEVNTLLTFEDIQLEKGSTATDYEPYGKYKIPVKLTNENEESTITNIYLDEPLRKAGDYADYIDFASNTVVRNVSTINLSDLSYKLQNQTVTGGYRAGLFSFPSSLSAKTMLSGTAQPGLSNVLPANTGAWLSFTTENIRFGQANTAFYIYTLNSYESEEDLLSYLGNGDVSLPYAIYHLATTILEPIQLSELKTFEDYTKIEVLTEIAPSKIEVEYKGYTLD